MIFQLGGSPRFILARYFLRVMSAKRLIPRRARCWPTPPSSSRCNSCEASSGGGGCIRDTSPQLPVLWDRPVSPKAPRLSQAGLADGGEEEGEDQADAPFSDSTSSVVRTTSDAVSPEAPGQACHRKPGLVVEECVALPHHLRPGLQGAGCVFFFMCFARRSGLAVSIPIQADMYL